MLFNIVFSNDQYYFGAMALEHNFFEMFSYYLLLQLSRVSYIKFAVFQVWSLTYYFYFTSNKADNFFFFFLNHCFHFVIYPRRLPIVKDFDFMGKKICHNIKNSFIENRDLLIDTLVGKSSFPVELGYGALD